VEKFEFGQNTWETLPNFRQKSKGIFKKNLKQEGQTARDLHPFNSSPRPPYLEPISTVGTVGTMTRPPFFSDPHRPRGAGIWPENHDFRRWFVRMPPELPARFLLRFSTKSIEGDSAEFSAEV
ncbi:hypothetical protein Prudu_014000, partial [Prunus dulcis]